MPSILFVCFANRFRSPLAAAFFRQRLEGVPNSGDWSVGSAGTWAEEDLPADYRAVQDASEMGLDISAHRSRMIDPELMAASDLVLVMEAGQKEALRVEFPSEAGKVFLLSEIAEGLAYDIPDPFATEDIPHQEIAGQLFKLIDRGFSNICKKCLPISGNDR